MSTEHTLPTDKIAYVDVETQGLQARTDSAYKVFIFGIYIKGEYTSITNEETAIGTLNNLYDKGYWFCYHNAKFDHILLRRRGFKAGWNRVLCTQVLSYLLQNNRDSFSLDALTGQKTDLLQALIDTGQLPTDCKKLPADWWLLDHSRSAATMQVLGNYNEQDLKATASLYKALVKKLEPAQVNCYFTLEQPFFEVLEHMETTGFGFNTIEARLWLAEVLKQKDELEEAFHNKYYLFPELQWNDAKQKYVPKEVFYGGNTEATPVNELKTYKNKLHVPPYYTDDNGVFVTGWEGHVPGESLVLGARCDLVPFNNSPATGHTWWLINREAKDTLKLAGKTKGGKTQINKDFIADIEQLLPDDVPISKLQKLDKRAQMLTTMLDNVVDGRIYCDVGHTRTLTGRLATQKPNCQNIPRADKDPNSEASKFRSLFKPAPGNVLAVADLNS